MKTPNPFDPAALSDKAKESAQQIWLAGLGAFAKAQEDGSKAFEKLVTDGLSMQKKAQIATEEKLSQATQKVTQAAHQFNERTVGQWDKLESIFEDRVAKALHRLGIPSAEELQELQARIAQLEAALGKSTPKAAKKTVAKKPAAKKSSTRK